MHTANVIRNGTIKKIVISVLVYVSVLANCMIISPTRDNSYYIVM